MTYLTENPWPITISLLVIAAFFAWNAMRTLQKKAWRVAQVCVGLALIPLAIDFLVETPREQVTSTLESLADAVRKNDAEKTLSFLGLEGVRQNVRAEMQRFEVQSLRLKTVRIKATETTATSDFRANGSVALTEAGGSRHVATRWVLEWTKEGDNWKIGRVRYVNPVTGEVIREF